MLTGTLVTLALVLWTQGVSKRATLSKMAMRLSIMLPAICVLTLLVAAVGPMVAFVLSDSSESAAKITNVCLHYVLPPAVMVCVAWLAFLTGSLRARART